MRHASLFSGIGGPEVAAAMLGWENVFHCEIDPFCRSVLNYWFPKSESYEDIRKTDFSRYRGRIDVLTGGFPCQPFSYAGKRKGADDDRYLWPEMFRAIDEIRPTWVIGENVAGISTMVERGILFDLGCEISLFNEGDALHGFQLKQPFTLERICQDFEHIGYDVQPMLIPAAACGAPHRRGRIFILAHDAKNANVPRCEESSDEIGCEDIQHRDLGSRDSERVRGETRSRSDVAHSGDARAENMRGRKAEIFPSGVASHSNSEGLEAALQSDRHDAKEWTDKERPTIFSANGPWIEEAWWMPFPTQSPVCRRDDGLPFDVDDLSISYGKWRENSIKAYGNAIVPQVMYRIFQAIEAV